MHAQTLFNLSLDHWPALLLSLIPAIVTLTSILYLLTRFPGYTINKVYFLFIVSIFIWQVNDSFLRMSVTLETATAWYRLFSIGWMVLIPSSIHWVLLLTGEKKLAYNTSFIFIIYFSALLFAIPLCAGIYSQTFSFSPFWGWVRTFDNFRTFQTAPLMGVVLVNFINVYILSAFAYKNRKSPDTSFPSLLVFLGYLIVVIPSFITEIYFQAILGISPIPISSITMLVIVLITSGLNTRTNTVLEICRDIPGRIPIAEERLDTLRSQMNPHFIFNSLNSIQHYIHSNEKEKAELFLSIFSSLIRQTLDNSYKTEIPLSDELSTIQLYLKLEKARFGNRLNFEILPEDDIDLENILVPSMLIQPYIENAIVHGLAPKADGGKVSIYLKQVSDNIICIIEDDGIGREKSIAFQSRKLLKTNSKGTSITKTRLEIINQHLEIHVSVKVNSLLNDRNQACGTRVEIHIPAIERF